MAHLLRRLYEDSDGVDSVVVESMGSTFGFVLDSAPEPTRRMMVQQVRYRRRHSASPLTAIWQVRSNVHTGGRGGRARQQPFGAPSVLDAAATTLDDLR